MLAWHYTTGISFVKIVESGELLPTAIGVKPPEKPVLWFSLNQGWENTANKAVRTEAGELRTLTVQETRVMGKGLVRFGYEARNLHIGESLRRKAGISQSVWRSLCAVAKKQGATPSDWCGSIEPISVDACVIEVMDEMSLWVRVQQ